MVGHLSEGAIAAIMQQGETSIKPILQVISIRPITTGNSPPRYRLLMSDGLNTLSSFMLATQLNLLVEESRLSSNCICQINRFIVNSLQTQRLVQGTEIILPNVRNPEMHLSKNENTKNKKPLCPRMPMIRHFGILLMFTQQSNTNQALKCVQTVSW
uniref:Replication protein A1 n=1 Tax=Molossus molossus TaxID=27622 RepID=A0A7J8D1L0_MOLMO|nr:replication protein A1 [Molossus molossus]